MFTPHSQPVHFGHNGKCTVTARQMGMLRAALYGLKQASDRTGFIPALSLQVPERPAHMSSTRVSPPRARLGQSRAAGSCALATTKLRATAVSVSGNPDAGALQASGAWW